MKSIVCVYGSPRSDGNSSLLADEFCSAASDAGASVSKYKLNDLDFSGCQNLFHCKTVSDHCGLDDGLTAVLDAVRESDVIVLASPIYFTDVSGLMKSFIDRWFSFFVPGYASAAVKTRLSAGKKVVLLQTQGEGDDQYKNILEKYNHSFKALGINESFLVRAVGVRDLNQIQQSPEVIEEAIKLGTRLAS